MVSGIRSTLNATFYYRFQEAITRQQVVPRSLYRNSALSLFLLHSTSFLSDTTRCLSILTPKTKLMAASTSKAFLGDIYVDDIVTSCSSALDVTKHTGVYFKDRSRKGCLRAIVDIRRPEPLWAPPSSGYSIYYANRRKQNSCLFHGPGLKNLSVTSPAFFSAEAAQHVSCDGSTCDDQLASPDQYVILIRLVLFLYALRMNLL